MNNMLLFLKFLLPLQVVLLLLLLPLVVGAQNGVPELSISEDASFKILVFVEDVDAAGEIRYRYQLEEAYSSEQRRTLVKYKVLGYTRDKWLSTANLPYEGTVIVDGDQKLPLLLADDGKGELWCRELRWWAFEQLCQIEQFRSSASSSSSRGDTSTKESHDRIHGPSRILFMLEQFKDQLKRGQVSVTVRNVPGVAYEVPQSGGNWPQLFVYYAKSQIGKQGKGLPLRVSVAYEDGHYVQYNFWSYPKVSGVADATFTRLNEAGDASRAHELIFDEFFIPRARGCSSLESSDDSTIAKLFATKDSFYFQARSSAYFNKRDMLANVAYHQGVHSMRVDRQTGSWGSNLLIDFNAGKTYRAISSESSEPAPGQKMKPIHLVDDDYDKNRCITIKSPKSSKSMEIMLFGSVSSKWRYLGLARVRGFRARAYEAYDTAWPMWLQQPISYTRNWMHDKNNLEFIYDTRPEPNRKYSLVVYLSDDQTDANANAGSGSSSGSSGGQLLHVEIFRIRESNHRLLEMRSISIYNFAWQVMQNTIWPDASSIFSMARKCDVAQETNQHLLVSMILSRVSGSHYEQLTDSLSANSMRDLSLIECLQSDLGLPSTMIYDLESQFMQAPTVGSQQSSDNLTALSVSFRLAKSQQKLIRLRYYGTGKLKPGYETRLTQLRAALRDCYYLAAHQRVNTFFGYLKETGDCVVDLHSDSSVLVSKTNVPKPQAFNVVTNGPMDIYLVHHDEPEDEPNLMALFRDSSQRASIVNQQLMKRLLVPSPLNRTLKLSFIISSFKITESHVKQTKTTTTTGTPQADAGEPADEVKSIYNFGLIPDSQQTKVFEFKHEEQVHYEQVMDFGACQTACLADVNCKTFSICSRGGHRVECVLTSVDLFRDTNLALQLTDIVSERPDKKLSREYNLKTGGDGEIRVKQRANCELHKKLYLDAFRKESRPARVDLQQALIEPVTMGPDECAWKCFEQTLKVLLKSNDLHKVVGANLESILNNPEQPPHPDYIDGINNVQRRLSKDLCAKFHHVDVANLALMPTNVIGQFQALVDANSDISGFCVTAKPTVTTSRANANNTIGGDASETAFVSTDEFSFRFETIYEKRLGVRLLASEKTPAETEAYRQISQLGEMPRNPAEFETLRGLIDRRENSQSSITTGTIDETLCAMACTLQTVGPWPSCRSFDMVVVARGLNETNTYCRMNSISYADAIEANRLDLIDGKSTHAKMQWHYEPKFSTLARWRPILDTSIRKPSQSVLAVWIVSILGLITGLAIGVGLGAKKFNLHSGEQSLIANNSQPNDYGLETHFNSEG